MKPFKFFPILLQIPIYWTTLLLFKIFCGLTVKGFENVQGLPPGIIFASNHVSEWDGILIRVALPFLSKKFSPMYYVSKTKEFYTNSGWRQILYGGFLFKLLGAYPVYSGKKDYNYSLQHYLEILRLKRNVCIFPEGIRTHDGTLGEAHGGVAFLSHTTGAPVVPVGINGLFGMTPRNFFLRRHHAQIIFGKPISSTDLFSSSTNGITPTFTPTISDFKSSAGVVMSQISRLLVSPE